MTFHTRPDGAHVRRRDAFTIAEVMVGVGFLATTAVAFYLALSSGFGFVKLARENLRATQIMVEKMETIRLYTWDQINAPGFVPTNFQTTFYPASLTNSGITYDGTLRISTPPVSASYSNYLRQVEVELTWTSGNVQRRRVMTTLFSEYGMQNYKP